MAASSRLLLAAQADARAKRDAGHRDLSVGALLHDAFGLVDIGVDHEPGAARKVDEEQHVAATRARR